VDLLPPTAESPLPMPVCPMGEVSGLGTEGADAEPPVPGTSPLDEGLRNLRAAFGTEGGNA